MKNNTPVLQFEGEYLNGKRYGKGNEYYFNGEIKFEGEYLNGERNGKGKEYYYDTGELEFEGEYFKGRKWTGKGYDELNNIVYELKNGNGLLKEYDDFGCLIFKKEYLNGRISGICEDYYDNGQLKTASNYIN